MDTPPALRQRPPQPQRIRTPTPHGEARAGRVTYKCVSTFMREGPLNLRPGHDHPAWPRLKPIRSYDRGVLSERHVVRRGCPGSSARPVAHNRVSQGSAPPGASGNRRASTREQRAEGGVQASPNPSATSCMCTRVSSLAPRSLRGPTPRRRGERGPGAVSYAPWRPAARRTPPALAPGRPDPHHGPRRRRPWVHLASSDSTRKAHGCPAAGSAAPTAPRSNRSLARCSRIGNFGQRAGLRDCCR